MKVKTISRSADTYVPARNTQELALPRNLNPALHPFERAREYTRAVTATKLERMFAQPFVGQMGDGHRDGIYCISKNFQTTNQIASGSGDGVVKYWNMSSRDEALSFRAHYGMVTGLAITPRRGMLSCGDDKTIKLWSLQSADFGEAVDDLDVYRQQGNTSGLLKTFAGEHAFSGLDHHFSEDVFVTGGAAIQLWNTSRSSAVANLLWGADNVTGVRFNKTETNVVASCGLDNSIVLYDIRTSTPVQKVVTALRANDIAWNPMEAYHFASGHDDHNAYLWDMRDLTKSLNVYKDHVSAVTSVDFCPTGKELVTGSYDKTIRIYRAREGHSRDIYHTKRMQRVFAVAYTTDSRYIVSGSDDANVRLWRANASERSNVKSGRERSKLNYDNKLKERYKYMPEVRRIARHRHLPGVVKKAQEIKRVEVDSLKRREENDRRNRKDGSRPRVPERQKHIRGTAWKD
ncbi:WD40 repeat-like protein [Metschnikowia bicuspidata var. bicuspidata NRRL YB-4993]|uniref:WD40 repeat-like protein n=1 Tax=Metschnikowia bicuspidata var. bicuspidata NRRL YB-4993 TaxID=869754 RepID=A0A1A0H9R0_9ASCO|nr:WD40 repeat-like protein [Metschnikowia bicuspidata var. bicuspidata NRRL YB-4993]OBA20751.1 WD40 repeat-like protein [Metschnikowia bicuspidata var. bicuspidata NRRL YB-4993]